MKDPSPQVFVTAVNLDSNREYVLPFNDVQERRWKHFYGVLPDLCCIIWRKLDAHNSIHGGDFKWPNVLRIVKVESRGRCRSFAGSTYCKGGRAQMAHSDAVKMTSMLDYGESAVADSGYVGEPHHIRTPQVGTEDKKAMQDKARARHETVNKRLKDFEVLGANRFRHDPIFHSSCFRAVAVITQLSFENGAVTCNFLWWRRIDVMSCIMPKLKFSKIKYVYNTLQQYYWSSFNTPLHIEKHSERKMNWLQFLNLVFREIWIIVLPSLISHPRSQNRRYRWVGTEEWPFFMKNCCKSSNLMLHFASFHSSSVKFRNMFCLQIGTLSIVMLLLRFRMELIQFPILFPSTFAVRGTSKWSAPASTFHPL